MEKWCGICRVWGSHSTAEHDSENGLTCTEITDENQEDNGDNDTSTTNQTPSSNQTPFAGLTYDLDFREGR